MPAYNAGQTIEASIGSVLVQDFTDWELVICNDGSIDETHTIALRYARLDPRIKVISQVNRGCGAARDAAVRASSAPWIVRLDADDCLLPNYLSAMNAFIEATPNYDIYSCNGIHVYPDGSERRARPGKRYEHETSFTYEDMLHATHIFTVAIFSRDIFERVGGISPTTYCEDLEFWLRALMHGASVRYTPQELAYYAVSDTQMSASFSKLVQSRVQIYQECVDSGLLTPKQVQETQDAILRVLQDERIYQKRSRLVGHASKLFGKQGAQKVSQAVHVISKPIRALIKRFPG